ncbi:MAG: DUF2007 domain-containing protein [Pirellulaceae bacterium]|nr:DUF2007 domain-containing protein [Planctomycetales bacterium]
MDENELIEVFSTNDANVAEVVRAALHAEGIKCEIDGEGQAGLTGLISQEIKIVVRTIDYDRARAYIEQHHAP